MISRAKLIQEFGTLTVLNLELATHLDQLREELKTLQAENDSLRDQTVAHGLRFPEILPNAKTVSNS